MKIKFLLDGGATVTLELEYLSQVRKALSVDDGPMWLWDELGNGVNLAKVAGFTVVEESATELDGQEGAEPSWVIDDDPVSGQRTRWDRGMDGKYRPRPGHIGWPLEKIEQTYGISDRGWISERG